MIATWVIALTAVIVYAILARCAENLATDVGVLFAIVIVAAWAVLNHLERGRR